MELSVAFRLRCEAISSEWRACLKLRAFDPLPASVLARELRATLHRPDEMNEALPEAIDYLSRADDWFGVILTFNPPLILYNPKQSPARYESTIMHELAHLILKHPPGRLYLTPDGTFTRDFASLIEAEAAYLGSCLQIPRRGFLWAEQKKMNNETIARHFGASLEMVRWRQNAIKL
jgi:Zn-dependent peptidase ImmA (M78 family)